MSAEGRRREKEKERERDEVDDVSAPTNEKKDERKSKKKKAPSDFAKHSPQRRDSFPPFDPSDSAQIEHESSTATTTGAESARGDEEEVGVEGAWACSRDEEEIGRCCCIIDISGVVDVDDVSMLGASPMSLSRALFIASCVADGRDASTRSDRSKRGTTGAVGAAAAAVASSTSPASIVECELEREK